MFFFSLIRCFVGRPRFECLSPRFPSEVLWGEEVITSLPPRVVFFPFFFLPQFVFCRIGSKRRDISQADGLVVPGSACLELGLVESALAEKFDGCPSRGRALLEGTVFSLWV